MWSGNCEEWILEWMDTFLCVCLDINGSWYRLRMCDTNTKYVYILNYDKMLIKEKGHSAIEIKFIV